MIDRTLPAVENFQGISDFHAAQCFAFCYLASYNHDAIPARVQLSMSRAWDYDSLLAVPRVVGGRPAYTVAIWNNTRVKRVIVAIEGMTSLGQVWTAQNGWSGVNPAGMDGWVQSSFDAHSLTITAELVANAPFMNAITVPGCQLQFSGFSLGAAIAEVLAAKFDKTYADLRVQLYKFASPMVGSGTWANSRQMPGVRWNYYCAYDPIFLLPYGLLRSINRLYTVPFANVMFFAPNRPLSNLNFRFEPIEPRNFNNGARGMDENYFNYVDACGMTHATMNERNWWWWHDREQYRAMFCGLVSKLDNHWHYRFRYLEFDDDNQWGQQYRPGDQFLPFFKEIADPAPSAVVASVEDAHVGGHDEEELHVGGLDDDQERQGESLTRPQQFPNNAWRPRRSSSSPLSQR